LEKKSHHAPEEPALFKKKGGILECILIATTEEAGVEPR